jgi:hypothetical protein
MWLSHVGPQSDPPTSSFGPTDNVDPESDQPILSSIRPSDILSRRPILCPWAESVTRVLWQNPFRTVTDGYTVSPAKLVGVGGIWPNHLDDYIVCVL